uniref:RHS repeat domain-containing protein n=1 Tax=Foetidibacter luteolus TaxID=2608880 RepID=UPI001A982D61
FAGKPLAMDKLGYRYKPNTNQLDHITDDVNAANYTEDIDGQGTNNYEYDEIGNLVKDKAEGIGQSQQSKIEWTVYGKISSIRKDNGMLIAYTYDAGGNRISKAVSNDGGTTTTWYVRDAGGNVMGVYVSGDNTKNSGRLTQTETHLYGSSRLGLYKAEVDVTLAATNTATLAGGKTAYLYSFTRGEKFFELSNHLGNVLAVVTDKKLQHTEDNSTVDYYLADVASANDYAPFGMQLVGRTVSTGGYRYGFNGKENDKETIGTSTYDYGFRIYSPAIGRFLSVDPLMASYPWYTPYQFAGNKPIAAIDLDGLEEKIVVSGSEESHGRYSLNFILPAMKKIDAHKTENKTTEVSWLIFRAGYTEKQVQQINSWSAARNVNVTWLNSSEEFVNYINTKNTSNNPSLVNRRKDDLIQSIDIYSHGIPGMFDFGHGHNENNAQGIKISEAYKFDESKLGMISQDAFMTEAVLTSNACRTGAGASIGDVSLFSSEPENSLAQKIADRLNITVNALQSRSLYTGILGNKVDLFLKDKFGSPTNRDSNGNDWMKNLNEIQYPTKGSTPYFAPGWTTFKKGKNPEVKNQGNMVVK